MKKLVYLLALFTTSVGLNVTSAFAADSTFNGLEVNLGNLYFHLKKQPYAMACDRYTTVADNLAAIAAHIDAVRAIERHGDRKISGPEINRPALADIFLEDPRLGRARFADIDRNVPDRVGKQLTRRNLGGVFLRVDGRDDR